MAIEIVDFPMKNGGSFHCYVNVHQRVAMEVWSFQTLGKSGENMGGFSSPHLIRAIFG